MRRYRNPVLVWSAICTSFLAVVALVLLGIREIERQFHRVASEEEAAIAWIAHKGGRFAKEGPNHHVVTVDLGGTTLSDSELGRLCALTRLRQVDLSATRISDGGLHALAPLTNLEYIDVSYTHVTPEGISVLESQHPQLKMVGCAGIER
jgi:hypothetical protein